jgi:hypothetical protein
MASSGLQVHNDFHVGLPPGINPQVRPQPLPALGPFLEKRLLACNRRHFLKTANASRPGGSHGKPLAVPGQNVIPDQKE